MKSIYMLTLRCCLISEIYIRINVVGNSITDFYYSNGVPKTWDDAKADCENRGMELATLDTADKHEAAKKFINRYSSRRDVFIGLSLDRSGSYPPYVYIYTNGIVPTYLPWGYHEPNDQSSDFCIRMHRSRDFGYFTISCTSTSYDYLCTSPIENQTTQEIESTVTTECDTTTTQADTTTVTKYDSTTTVTKHDSTTQRTSTTVEAGYDGSTTQADGTSVQRHNGCLLDCFCPCSDYTNRWLYLMCGNYTREEMKEIMKSELNEMQDNLKVDPKNTSRYIRSITSASDSRISSLAIGSVGIAVLSTIAFVIVLLDCNKFVNSCRHYFCQKNESG